MIFSDFQFQFIDAPCNCLQDLVVLLIAGLNVGVYRFLSPGMDLKLFQVLVQTVGKVVDRVLPILPYVAQFLKNGHG